MGVASHDDHFTMHEHYHGDHENILVTTIGLVMHSIADGLALGASLFCKQALCDNLTIVSHKTDRV